MRDKLKEDIANVRETIAEVLRGLKVGKTEKIIDLFGGLQIFLSEEYKESGLEEVKIAYNKAGEAMNLLAHFLKDGDLRKKGRIEEILNDILDLEDKISREGNESQELPKRVIQKIMSKVQDINSRGTAHSGIIRGGKESVKNIFKYGIQGVVKNINLDLRLRDRPKVKTIEPYGTGKDWRKVLKERKRKTPPFVFFNITGRNFGGSDLSMRYGRKLTILFDISNLKEEEPASAENLRSPVKRNHYRCDSYASGMRWIELKKKHPNIKLGDSRIRPLLIGGDKDYFDDRGFPMSDSEYGFILSPRVPPRRITGIVVDYSRLRREGDPKKVISSYVEGMTEGAGKKLNLLVPIYDSDRNLLWPEKMNYEEVKKYVKKKS